MTGAERLLPFPRVFPVWAIMNRAATNIGRWVLVGNIWERTFYFSDKYPGVGLLGYVVRVCLTL